MVEYRKMKKPLLTAVILTKNEEENLPRCLGSIDWIEEIIVVDDDSIDKTVEIAEKAGAAVYRRKLDDFCSQRNFVLSKVKTPWVFFIDADEESTEELAKEIKQAIKSDEYDGYRFPRKNIIFGKWIEHSGWYPDYQLHLFKKDKGRYVRKVHEQVEVNGKVGDLQSSLVHYNYQSISQYLEKLFRYTTLEAENQSESGYRFSWADLWQKPLSEFLRRFFAERGYKDGIHGLVLSLLQAFSELIVYLKIWEKEGFKEEEISEVFDKIKMSQKEINYWLEKQERNPFKKVLRKITR